MEPSAPVAVGDLDATMRFDDIERALQRTSHDGWANPNSEPLENLSCEVQY
jgi:hypothetical protein